MKIRRTPGGEPELRVPGLTDRSERPTTHALFAPMEREKQREEKALRKRLRRSRRARKSSP
jgi:hypothetical protein